ncbi:MAG: DUF4430 domain-containing protein [Ruminococcaceae bacterium]|nr:DUF4430 domain-containing protein [Oscillospiraceae bacterium]
MKKKHILWIGAIILALFVGSFALFGVGDSPDISSPETLDVNQEETMQQPEKMPVAPDGPMPETQTPVSVVQEEKTDAPEEDAIAPDTTSISGQTEYLQEPTDNRKKCILSVRCDDVLRNMALLPKGKEKIIPPDGIIYRAQEVVFEHGESAFDVLLKEMRRNNIHMEFVNTPMFESSYIEGIGNLYEFDCGEYSGWLYRVNGEKQTYGSSRYILKEDDKVEFYYSCNWMQEGV